MTAIRKITIDRDFGAWRNAARMLLRDGVPPEYATWHIRGMSQGSLYSSSPTTSGVAFTAGEPAAPVEAVLRIPREFFALAEYVACHRDEDRFSLLYRVAWRLTQGEHHLLRVAVDDDVIRLTRMVRQVRRDRHKMTAFIRFSKIVLPDGGDYFVAWYRPDHFIVRLAADHFVSRFGVMRWSILTPDDCVQWDGNALKFSQGVSRDAAPDADELESLWKTYYASTFNPARIKLNMMKREMPVRFWPTLPETAAIPDMLAAAPMRVSDMIKRTARAEAQSAAPLVPQTQSLSVLTAAAAGCLVCPWAKNCTQTVFGEGPKSAKLVFVGEQPGDQEDRQGHPFVGPAGGVFADALEQVGIDRESVYVTNAVKHFKFEPRGKMRLHQKPSSRDVAACRPWLMAELGAIRPPMIVALGATAAQSLFGPEIRITKQRGKLIESRWAPWNMVTYHPSALLRAPDEIVGAQMRRDFLGDLRKVAKQLAHADDIEMPVRQSTDRLFESE